MVTVFDGVGCYTEMAGGTSGSAAERGVLAYCACAAAASYATSKTNPRGPVMPVARS